MTVSAASKYITSVQIANIMIPNFIFLRIPIGFCSYCSLLFLCPSQSSQLL
jgi:hypothetical protein